MRDYILHLDNIARRWDDASPVGNGFEGAMIYGGVSEERLQYNEESIWAGGPMDTKIEGFMDKINYLRHLLTTDREYEAEMWAEENMKNDFFNIKSYEYAGELFIKLHEDDDCKKYKRDIDLMNGICAISYEKDGKQYNREYFASYPDRLVCCRYTASTTFTASLRYVREKNISTFYSTDSIIAESETADSAHKFKIIFWIKTDGISVAEENGLNISNANYIEIYSRIFTDFKYDDIDSAIKDTFSALDLDYERIKAAHVDDFSSLMNRSEIAFDQDPALDEMTTFIRIKRLIRDCDAYDYRLMSLYWQFGKYLLISSSRPGSLPANLQGIWADGLQSPWNSDYHTNINLQMNYWQAEGANIAECIDPLFNFMNNFLIPAGKKVAQENYNSPGLVIHHLTDIYGFAACADWICGLWPVGGAWLAYHLWEHYLYTNDVEFLRDTAYTYIRECVDFSMNHLFEGPDGYLHTGPSVSPEHSYYDFDGNKALLAISPTMDVQIIGGLLDFYAECEDILGIDPACAEKARAMRKRLVPMQIGKYGQLMEWYKDFEDTEPHHRHISHAFGLYPAAQITKSKTPDLYKAIETAIDRRLHFGGAGTGWSRAWVINLMARLGRGDSACDNVRELFKCSTYYNLFDKHPPFQIDGNFGGSAGITEMVLQSHEDYISIIPAVSNDLNGTFTGLRARGGITVSAKWNNCRVEWLELTPDTPCDVKIKVPGEEIFEVKLDKKTRINF